MVLAGCGARKKWRVPNSLQPVGNGLGRRVYLRLVEILDLAGAASGFLEPAQNGDGVGMFATSSPVGLLKSGAAPHPARVLECAPAMPGLVVA
jgi:hypothetical protein